MPALARAKSKNQQIDHGFQELVNFKLKVPSFPATPSQELIEVYFAEFDTFVNQILDLCMLLEKEIFIDGAKDQKIMAAGLGKVLEVVRAIKTYYEAINKKNLFVIEDDSSIKYKTARSQLSNALIAIAKVRNQLDLIKKVKRFGRRFNMVLERIIFMLDEAIEKIKETKIFTQIQL